MAALGLAFAEEDIDALRDRPPLPLKVEMGHLRVSLIGGDPGAGRGRPGIFVAEGDIDPEGTELWGLVGCDLGVERASGAGQLVVAMAFCLQRRHDEPVAFGVEQGSVVLFAHEINAPMGLLPLVEVIRAAPHLFAVYDYHMGANKRDNVEALNVALEDRFDETALRMLEGTTGVEIVARQLIGFQWNDLGHDQIKLGNPGDDDFVDAWMSARAFIDSLEIDEEGFRRYPVWEGETPCAAQAVEDVRAASGEMMCAIAHFEKLVGAASSTPPQAMPPTILMARARIAPVTAVVDDDGLADERDQLRAQLTKLQDEHETLQEQHSKLQEEQQQQQQQGGKKKPRSS